jgi:hypothetical protein
VVRRSKRGEREEKRKGSVGEEDRDPGRASMVARSFFFSPPSPFVFVASVVSSPSYTGWTLISS